MGCSASKAAAGAGAIGFSLQEATLVAKVSYWWNVLLTLRVRCGDGSASREREEYDSY